MLRSLFLSPLLGLLLLSAPGLAAPSLPVPALPPAVVQTRDTLITYARAGRYEALAGLAAQAGDGFTYHRGFELRKPVAYWRGEAAAGRSPLPRLVAILRTPPIVEDGLWIWPAAAAAKPTLLAWASLRAAYPASQVARFHADGYTGWRCGIDVAGRWRRFLSG